MREVTGTERPPLGVRLLHALGTEPDWSAMTAEELIGFREAENRERASRLARVITGFPDRGAAIGWQEVSLPDRRVRVRVYRPRGAADLPLVLHVHGGGFVGTAARSDWVNSHLAARLPAVVVSVEHRLLAPETPLPAAVDDGWDVLGHLLRHAAEWGIDPARTAILGESTGGLIAALAAIRAKESGLDLRAQVLVNPAVDLTETMFDHPSFILRGHLRAGQPDCLRQQGRRVAHDERDVDGGPARRGRGGDLDGLGFREAHQHRQRVPEQAAQRHQAGPPAVPTPAPARRRPTRTRVARGSFFTLPALPAQVLLRGPQIKSNHPTGTHEKASR